MRKRWDQWVERFRNTSLARKMMVVYAAIFGILCGITLLAMQVTLSIYDGQLYQKSLEELNFFTERVDGELKKVEELSFDLAMDYEIQNCEEQGGIFISDVEDAKPADHRGAVCGAGFGIYLYG